MNKHYYIIIQPDNFDEPTDIINIIIMDMEKNLLYSGEMNKEAEKIITELMRKVSIFITYNGELLDNMLNLFFLKDYKYIVSLMDIFATEYGEYNEYFGSYTYKKLELALIYYKNRGYKINDCKVNIYNPMEVLEKTILLYEAMQDWEEKKVVNKND